VLRGGCALLDRRALVVQGMGVGILLGGALPGSTIGWQGPVLSEACCCTGGLGVQRGALVREAWQRAM
jgi:hypothetical protein